MKYWYAILMAACVIMFVVYCAAMLLILIIQPFAEAGWNRLEIAAAGQAFFTIFAVAVAIFVPWQVHKNERTREEGIRHLRAHSLAHAIYPDLMVIRAGIAGSNKVINRSRTHLQIHTLPIHNLTQDWLIDMPEGFNSAIDQFYLLGDAAAPVVSQLLSLLQQHNQMVNKFIQSYEDESNRAGLFVALEHENLFQNLLDIMEINAEEAYGIIGKIRDRELTPTYAGDGREEGQSNSVST